MAIACFVKIFTCYLRAISDHTEDTKYANEQIDNNGQSTLTDNYGLLQNRISGDHPSSLTSSTVVKIEEDQCDDAAHNVEESGAAIPGTSAWRSRVFL